MARTDLDVTVHVEQVPSRRLLAFFEYEHLPKDLAEVSYAVWQLAHGIDHLLPEGPEKTAGLRKLLEAKDCFVRARLEARKTEQEGG